MEKITAIASDCLERIWPDLTIILDLEIETAAQRLNKQLDRMEQKGDGYHQKVREGFLQLSRQRDDFAVVNAGENIQVVHENVIKIVKKTFSC